MECTLTHESQAAKYRFPMSTSLNELNLQNLRNATNERSRRERTTRDGGKLRGPPGAARKLQTIPIPITTPVSIPLRVLERKHVYVFIHLYMHTQ